MHKKIKSFFEQFKPDAQNLSKIRKQIESGTHHSSSSDYEHDIIDSEGYLVDRLTSEDKVHTTVNHSSHCTSAQIFIRVPRNTEQHRKCSGCAQRSFQAT